MQNRLMQVYADAFQTCVQGMEICCCAIEGIACSDRYDQFGEYFVDIFLKRSRFSWHISGAMIAYAAVFLFLWFVTIYSSSYKCLMAYGAVYLIPFFLMICNDYDRLWRSIPRSISSFLWFAKLMIAYDSVYLIPFFFVICNVL